MTESEARINSYLHFGYLPDTRAGLPVDVRHDPGSIQLREELGSMSKSSLIAEGARRLKGAFEKTFAEAGNKEPIVPLSGGLDSRAILGWLVQNVGSQAITTVTFGTPKTRDFEFGKAVAKEAGVRNIAIDLSQIPLETGDLVDFATLIESPVPIFEAFLFHQLRTTGGLEGNYWSGFMGEVVSGAHLLKQDSGHWEQAKALFALRDRFSRSIQLTTKEYDLHSCLPLIPWFPKEALCYDEQIDFGIRQACLAKPVLFLPGYNYSTPFRQAEWADFSLNLPRKYREGQQLYKEVIASLYPRLFRLPTKTKTNFGLPLTAPLWRKALLTGVIGTRAIVRRLLSRWYIAVPPWTNYIDFNQGLRVRPDLKQVVYDNIQDLKARGIIDWIDIDSIWLQHQHKRGDYADALTLLASLEVNLKAGKLQ